MRKIHQWQSNAKSISCHGVSTWWRHRMETCSALLVFCAGNSPVTGELPSQRPVTRSCDVLFDLLLRKHLNTQPRRRWFEMHIRTPLYWCFIQWFGKMLHQWSRDWNCKHSNSRIIPINSIVLGVTICVHRIVYTIVINFWFKRNSSKMIYRLMRNFAVDLRKYPQL